MLDATTDHGSKSTPTASVSKKTARRSHQEVSDEIISRLDIAAEYALLGVVLCADAPRPSSVIECYAFGRDDKKPSAFINVTTGRYVDKGGDGHNFALWDFAAHFFPSRWPTWQAARAYFADKAGVKVSLSGTSAGSLPPDRILWFEPWEGTIDKPTAADEGRERLIRYWCDCHKAGCSYEAVRAAGGVVAYYRTWFDKKTNEPRRGNQKCIALPCFGEKLTDAPPVAWVIWRLDGQPIERRRKNAAPEYSKMLSIGPTAGTLMNAHACRILAGIRAARRGGVFNGTIPPDYPLMIDVAGRPRKCLVPEIIHKTAGPSDMLAMMTAIPTDPPELRRKHLVIANASGETGLVPPWVAELLQGLKVYVTHDADDAGEAGAGKWLERLSGWCAEVRAVALPYERTKKNGRDVRDFLVGV